MSKLAAARQEAQVQTEADKPRQQLVVVTAPTFCSYLHSVLVSALVSSLCGYLLCKRGPLAAGISSWILSACVGVFCKPVRHLYREPSKAKRGVVTLSSGDSFHI